MWKSIMLLKLSIWLHFFNKQSYSNGCSNELLLWVVHTVLRKISYFDGNCLELLLYTKILKRAINFHKKSYFYKNIVASFGQLEELILWSESWCHGKRATFVNQKELLSWDPFLSTKRATNFIFSPFVTGSRVSEVSTCNEYIVD